MVDGEDGVEDERDGVRVEGRLPGVGAFATGAEVPVPGGEVVQGVEHRGEVAGGPVAAEVPDERPQRG
ncbi:hypothetical protein [Micromonospora sp. NPDC049799]|uniref:hypothetical protein n=1 Tax=Micromonospora sp. NPDC049799 TaxID=3154741 RepID=UPI0033CCB3DB